MAVSSTLAADPKRSPAQTLPSCVKASCEMVFSRSIRGVGYDALSAARCDLFRFSFFCVGRSASRLCNAKIKRGAHYSTTGRRYCFFLGTIVLTVSPCKAVDIKESSVTTINHRTRNGILPIIHGAQAQRQDANTKRRSRNHFVMTKHIYLRREVISHWQRQQLQ